MVYRILISVTALSLLLDQLTKHWAVSSLGFLVQKKIIGDFLRFSLTFNTRGIFGLPLGTGITYYILPLIGIGLVLYFALRTEGYLYPTAFGLILGGALGNILDRVRLGRVIDFIDIGIKNLRWYTFNVADAFIVFGIILLLFKEREKGHEDTRIKSGY